MRFFFAFPACLTLALAAPPARAQPPPPFAYALAPEWWQVTPMATRPKSPAMMGVGIGAWGLGVVLTAVGSFFLVQAATEKCTFVELAHPTTGFHRPGLGVARQADCGDASEKTGVGAALLIAGQTTSFVGIPLFLVGLKHVPEQPATTGSARRPTLFPELRLGLSSELRLRF